jgi:hypothetical protein
MSQREIVMERFRKGKLRTPSGKKVTDPMQAVAIGYSEDRSAKKRGTEMRTFKGDRRRRPKKVRG